MGMTGEMKVARLRELALGKRIPMIWLLDSAGRAHPGGRGLAVRRLGPPLPRGGHDERGGAAGRRADGALRRRHGLHPGPRRLRADGQGPRLDGARGAAPHEGGHRRGRDPGGARRLAHPHARVRRGRPRGRLRRGVHPGDQGLPLALPAELRGAAAAARALGPGRAHGRGPARPAARLAAPPLRHVRADPPDRGRRRVVRHQAALGAHDHHVPGAHGRAAGGDRGEPAEAPRRHPRERLGRQGGALHQPLRRLRHPAAVPDGRAGLHGRARRSSRRASSGTGRRCSMRSRARPCRR